ncbi:1-acyl-sn-glycerol-3-phosphate acyltransferase [Microscilla marina]|uniref:1-acyl-sn-glycerol-3-phosphate acyltransferase n=1 Tax=Microscilla marina ATCC 23134 TaxID=313606 RepID=A1ZHS4_MICM2|nr:lysophospholipid acyltransferase family protein [Microscilla marina]EAY30081.1 1-acyl-sn-glycerol-3-phosphate acyltransferase [Microscilla marina ATCC 23134]
MDKILGWLLLPFFAISFLGSLVVFEVIQRIAYFGFGYKAHKNTVDILQLCIMNSLRLGGTRFKTLRSAQKVPTDRPIIIISNHQSMFDIPSIIWLFRKNHAKFVAKKELGKGIPSISFNLKHGGSVLIDRKDREQATQAIENLGKYIEEHNRAACIFPEGTRSRDGMLKPFKTTGIKTLLQHSPSALVIPVAISGSWELLKYKLKPIPFGVKYKTQILPPIEPANYSADEIVQKAEEQIRMALGQENTEI